MISRLCLQKDFHSSQAHPCTVEEMLKEMRSVKVEEICERIKNLSPALSQGEGEQVTGSLHSDQRDPEIPQDDNREFTPEEIKERIQQLKQGLPAITPHACRFTDNKRSNKSAIASGLVMLDVDHIDFERNEIVANSVMSIAHLKSEEMQEFYKENGIYLVAITPSGHGLRVIGERLHGETIEAGQRRLASKLDIHEYDTCTKDLARLSYLMPWSYVLYFDASGFYWEDELEGEYWLNNSQREITPVQYEELIEAGKAGENDRMAQEALNLAGTGDDQLVLVGQLVHAHDRDDVL